MPGNPRCKARIRTEEATCAECGFRGEGGEVETADGRVWHFRNMPKGKLSRPLPIKCFGKFVERKP